MIMKAESSPGALLYTDISCITRDSLDEETVAKPIFLSIHYERKRKKNRQPMNALANSRLRKTQP